MKKPIQPRYPETKGGLVYPEHPSPTPAPKRHEPVEGTDADGQPIPSEEVGRQVMRKVTQGPRERGEKA